MTLESLRAVGEGIDLTLRGALDTAASPKTLNGRISGEAQATVLELVRPGLAAERTPHLRRGRVRNGREARVQRFDPHRRRPISGVRLFLRGPRGHAPAGRQRRRAGGPAGQGRRRRGLRGRNLPARRRKALELPRRAPGPPRLRARDSIAAADRRRGSRGLRGPREPGDPGRDHAAARDVHEGRRSHRLGPDGPQPAGRGARRPRALEGAHVPRRPHRLGGVARGAQQRGPPLRHGGSERAGNAGRAGPSRPDPPRRRRARRLLRRPVRDRVRRDHVLQHHDRSRRSSTCARGPRSRPTT